ncbi:MAG: DNA repair protein RadC [Bacteroides sp.]|nr:DNA repair protein RadC [Bacteroides sp.]
MKDTKKCKDLPIKDWAEEDRPREKMMKKGPDVLTDAELMAILVGSGNTEESAIDLMRRILKECNNNLNTLGKWNHLDFQKFRGIGEAKACMIMAALELGKRRTKQTVADKKFLHTSKDIYSFFHPILCDLTQEEFWVLFLTQSSRLSGQSRISVGGIDGTYADVRSILREALLAQAPQIAIIHNHPSGNPQPSRADRRVTAAVLKGAEAMNIRLMDHVIVCDGSFFSFADEGLI